MGPLHQSKMQMKLNRKNAKIMIVTDLLTIIIAFRTDMLIISELVSLIYRIYLSISQAFYSTRPSKSVPRLILKSSNIFHSFSIFSSLSIHGNQYQIESSTGNCYWTLMTTYSVRCNNLDVYEIG